jgi:hypothetical protein
MDTLSRKSNLIIKKKKTLFTFNNKKNIIVN